MDPQVDLLGSSVVLFHCSALPCSVRARGSRQPRALSKGQPGVTLPTILRPAAGGSRASSAAAEPLAAKSWRLRIPPRSCGAAGVAMGRGSEMLAALRCPSPAGVAPPASPFQQLSKGIHPWAGRGEERGITQARVQAAGRMKGAFLQPTEPARGSLHGVFSPVFPVRPRPRRRLPAPPGLLALVLHAGGRARPAPSPCAQLLPVSKGFSPRAWGGEDRKDRAAN